jgi:hypothetical protein
MNAMKARVLCLAAQTYNMVDPNTKEVIDGVSLYYLPKADLTPSDTDNGGYGTQVSKDRLAYEKRDKLVHFPAIYEVTLEMVSKKGKTALAVTDLDFVSCVELKQVPPNADSISSVKGKAS